MEDLRKFDSYTEYRAALIELLSHAQSELCLCDRSLEESDLNSPLVYQLLWDFLTLTSNTQLKILVARTDYLSLRCPRVKQLYSRFSHKLTIRHIENPPDFWQQSFILCKQDTYLKRYHFDWPRGEFGKNTKEYAQLAHIFALLWEQSTPLQSMQDLHL